MQMQTMCEMLQSDKHHLLMDAAARRRQSSFVYASIYHTFSLFCITLG